MPQVFFLGLLLTTLNCHPIMKLTLFTKKRTHSWMRAISHISWLDLSFFSQWYKLFVPV